MSKNDKPTTIGKFLIFDVIMIILWTAFFAGTTALTKLEMGLGLPDWAFIPCVLLNAFVVLCIMGFVIPKPKVGAHSMSSKNATFWFINFQFSRVWGYPVIKHFIFSIGILRTIFLKCCGAKISFAHAFSSYAHLHDPYFLTIKKGATVGMHTSLVSHYINKGKLVLGPISIGENALVGAWTRIGPDCSIGDNAFISADVTINPGTTIPNDFKVGHSSALSRKDKFVAGESVPSFYGKGK
ncbi:hypothetical protein A9Q84_19090 [Halobacteriovorax marinus]|uniref:Acetyltransferase n=1 Tax=Halobacteriovorax marinus TaxID=97084 RepID=A0A1Y5F2B2_9BACT|nr:hypothetical protein A9Q84_19090 [Halobacteriovorax marinus]